MPRQITVKLELDIRSYIKSAAEAEAVTKGLDEQLHSLDDNSKTVGRDMQSTARETDKVTKSVDDFGAKTRRVVGDVQGLDNQIKAAKTSVGQLSVAFAQSGSDLDRKNLNDAKRVLSTLEKTRKDILAFAASDTSTRAAQLVAAGVTDAVTTSVKSGLQEGFSLASLSEVAIPALIGGVALLTPTIGALVSAAVVGTVGTGGLLGGIVSASKDPRVKSAFGSFLSGVETQFFSSGSAFVTPIEQSLQILSKDIGNLHLDEAFAKAAPFLTTLATGIGQFVTDLMPGFNKIMDQSGPFIEVFSNGLDETGQALNAFLEDVATSPGALEALSAGFDGVASSIRGIGGVLHYLTDLADDIEKTKGPNRVYEKRTDQILDNALGFFTKILPAIGSALAETAANIANPGLPVGASIIQNVWSPKVVASAAALAAASMDNAHAFVEAANKAYSYHRELEQLNQDMIDAIDNSLNLWRDTLNVKQAMADATDTIKKNGKQWDQNTQAARDNQSAIENALRAAKREYDDAIKAAGNNQQAIDAATRAYDAQVRKLEQLAKQAGATQKELAQIEGNYYINIITTSPTNATLSQIHAHHHAAGGFDAGDKPFVAGENGPELVFTGQPAYVLNHRQSMAWTGGPAASGDRTLTLIVKDTSGRTLRTELISEAYTRGVSSTTVNAAYP